MRCSNCDSTVVSFLLDQTLRTHAPTDADAIGLCPRCLTLQELDDPTSVSDTPSFNRISESFPDGKTAPPTALLLGLLDSLALNRSSIETLIERIEAEGTDPLLLLDRLANQGSVAPRWDVDRRRHQLEQLLERQDF
ncbi:DUF6276 family protein [Halocatena halophila]|uniref:DUF6276 family protein n=1 Tax=Halocatena halophila TaxID=2814576 RepID=UPI002ED0B463